MPQAHFIIGIQGAGKTYFSRNLHKKYGGFIIRRDSIRFMLYNYPYSGVDYIPEMEPIIDESTRAIFKALIHGGYSIIFDETNLTTDFRMRYINELPENYEVIFHYIDIPIEKALYRNDRRKRKLDPHIIITASKKLEPPVPEEYDKLIIYDYRHRIVEVKEGKRKCH